MDVNDVAEAVANVEAPVTFNVFKVEAPEMLSEVPLMAAKAACLLPSAQVCLCILV